jgi:hypothetical protein
MTLITTNNIIHTLIRGRIESIQDISPWIHPWRNKKPVSDKPAPEFIRGVNDSI